LVEEVEEAYVPAAHSAQAAYPEEGDAVPVGQGVQSIARPEELPYLPGTQLIH